MLGFKLRKIPTQTGLKAQYEPILISIDLTPEQRAMIQKTTGQSVSKLELTADEMKVILAPRMGTYKFY